MKFKDIAPEPQALLEVRQWKRQVSDLIREKGWDAFLRHSAAVARRWERKGLIRTRVSKPPKTVRFGFPEEVGRELIRTAKAEKRSVAELVREAVRQYRAARTARKIAAEGQKFAKKKKLIKKDFGGPFAR